MRAFIGVLLLGVCLADRVHFNGYQVWQVFQKNPDDEQFLMNQQSLGVLEVSGSMSHSGAATITIAPEFISPVSAQLRERKMKWSVQIQDLEKLIKEEQDRHKAHENVYDPSDFNTLDENINHLADYVDDCPARGLHCEIHRAGKSYEGRPINVYKISTGENKPIVWIDATIHAREWLATTTAVRIFDHLIDDYGTDANVTSMLNTHDFWILPIGNPDGYLHSWTKFRLWRKNRKPFNVKNKKGKPCVGVDLNRNFNFRWCKQGASKNPCTNIFCGKSAASEPETRAYQRTILAAAPRITTMLTLHSFGEYWLHPWGNTKNFRKKTKCLRAKDHDDMYKVAKGAADAIFATSGRKWAFGTSCEVIQYATTGATDDWSKGKAGIKYSFNPEVRGTDFVVNSTEIEPSFKEVWAATVNVVKTIESIEGAGYPLNL